MIFKPERSASVSIKINLGLFLWDRVPNKLKQMNETVQSAVIGWNSTTVIGASFRSGPLCGPLLHRSPAVVFFDCQHPDFWDFSSALPVDIVRVKSLVNGLSDLHPACVEMGITMNKLYLFQSSRFWKL